MLHQVWLLRQLLIGKTIHINSQKVPAARTAKRRRRGRKGLNGRRVATSRSKIKYQLKRAAEH